MLFVKTMHASAVKVSLRCSESPEYRRSSQLGTDDTDCLLLYLMSPDVLSDLR